MQNHQTTQSISNTESTLERTLPLAKILEEYKGVSLKLFQFSDVANISAAEQEGVTKEETRLLDRQAELLEIALSAPVESMDDAKSMLSLWHSEIVQSTIPGELDAPDELVLAVHQFLSAQ